MYHVHGQAAGHELPSVDILHESQFLFCAPRIDKPLWIMNFATKLAV